MECPIRFEPWRYAETSSETCGPWDMWQTRGFQFAERIHHGPPDKVEILCSNGGCTAICRTLRGAPYRDQEWFHFVCVEGRTYPVDPSADHLFLEAKIVVYLMALDGDPEAMTLEGRQAEVGDECPQT